MKTIPILHTMKIACLALAAIGLTAGSSQAQTVIGNWEGGSSDGWIDWNDLNSVTNDAGSTTSAYSFSSFGAVLGSSSLCVSNKAGGFSQTLAIKLEYQPGLTDAFLTNQLLSFTWRVPAGKPTDSGYTEIYNITINASGYGWNDQSWANGTVSGNGSGGNGAKPQIGFWGGCPVQTQRVTLNYSSVLPLITSPLPTNGFIEIIFGLNGDGTHDVFYFDDVTLSQTSAPPVYPPPTMAIGKAVSGLRIFAGSAGQNDRAELATVDQNQSWIGGTYPVSYSFRLLDYPADIGQTHIFLIPVNSMPGGPYSYNGIDYTSTNGLWLVISPYSGAQVTATIYWKTNLPNANAYATGGNTALRITNSTAVGTWTLTFTGTNAGTLTAPGASAAPFTIADATVATDFTNPLVAYFGLQPNAAAGVGEYEDWGSISDAGVAGEKESEDFTKESGRVITASGYWNTAVAGLANELVLVSTNDIPGYWLYWSMNDKSLPLGSKTNLLTGSWIDPTYYSGYGDAPPYTSAPYGGRTKYGTNNWTLLPKDDLPTVNGAAYGVPGPKAFFQLSTNVVQP